MATSCREILQEKFSSLDSEVFEYVSGKYM